MTRPTQPLAQQPAGYVQLARYSSLGYLWSLLRGAAACGRTVGVVRGDAPETARRRISGYTLPQAGIFADTARLLSVLDDGFVPHPALLALLQGDPTPLREELSAHYCLQLDFVVALTRNRDLIVRPELNYAAQAGASLPAELKVPVRRLGRDELHLLLLRSCGMAQ